MNIKEVTMYHKILLNSALLGFLALPVAASAFVAENGVPVTPAAGNSFDVGESWRYGVPGQWCAAADYVKRNTSAKGRQRIYVIKPGQTKRSVVFSLDPQGTTPTSVMSVSRSAKIPGANFSVQRAYSFCIEQRGLGFER